MGADRLGAQRRLTLDTAPSTLTLDTAALACH